MTLPRPIPPKVGINSVEFTIRLVEYLDRLIDFNRASDCKNKHPKADNCTQCATKSYEPQNRVCDTQIPYDCTQRNYIYAIRSMICHADEIQWAMKVANQDYQKNFLPQPFGQIAYNNFVNDFICQFSNAPLKVASIGYASGTDLLAMLKFLPSLCFSSSDNDFLEVLRIDSQEDNWQKAAETVESFIRKNADLDFDFTVSTNKENFLGKTHVFILSYVLNELNQQQVQDILEQIKQLANDNFLIVINEIAYNSHPNSQHAYAWENIAVLRKNIREHFNSNSCFAFRQFQEWHDTQFYANFRPAATHKYAHYQQKYGMKLHRKSTFHIEEYTKK